MDGGSLSLLIMALGYAGGAGVAVFVASARGARLATACGASVGAAGGLAAAATVLVGGRPIEAVFSNVLAQAGGIVLHVDRLGAFFLVLVTAVGLVAAVYGFSSTAEYDGRTSQ